jgi:hypothetical protein
MFDILEIIMGFIKFIFVMARNILTYVWLFIPFNVWVLLLAILVITGIILLIYFYVIKKKDNEDPNMPHTINQSNPTTTRMF